MSMSHARFVIPLAMLGSLPMPAAALLPAVYSFSTGDPDGLIATAARPESRPENSRSNRPMTSCSPNTTSITSATFTGLVPAGSSATGVVVEIYRVFPTDSDVGAHQRAANVLDGPGAHAGQFALRYRARRARHRERPISRPRSLDPSFTANNSVTAGRYPSQTEPTPPAATVRSRARKCSSTVNFATPFVLPADHYFFVPQVELGRTATFFWLSAPKPVDPIPARLHRPAKLDSRSYSPTT